MCMYDGTATFSNSADTEQNKLTSEEETAFQSCLNYDGGAVGLFFT